MKRILSILLALVVLIATTTSLSACQVDKTELTQKNYKDYLYLEIDDQYLTQTINQGQFGNNEKNTSLYFKVRSSGVSTNFNYFDVTIKIRIYGTYDICSLHSTSNKPEGTETFEAFVEFRTNVAGNTTEAATSDSISGNGNAILNCSYDYEIVSIVGTVVPA